MPIEKREPRVSGAIEAYDSGERTKHMEALIARGFKPRATTVRADKRHQAVYVIFVAGTFAGVFNEDGFATKNVEQRAKRRILAQYLKVSVRTVTRLLKKASHVVNAQLDPGRPLKIASKLPPSPNPQFGDNHCSATALELSREPEWRDKFASVFMVLPDGKEIPTSNLNYFRVPAWIWDPNSPLTRSERVILTLLFREGLGPAPDKASAEFKRRGCIAPRVKDLARRSGYSEHCVYTTLRRLEHRELIRRVRVTGEQDGMPHSEPSQIFWIAGRIFDKPKALYEQSRFWAALRRLREDNRVNLMRRVHRAILAQWQGTERTLKTFYRAVREEMARESVPVDLIACAIPEVEASPP